MRTSERMLSLFNIFSFYATPHIWYRKIKRAYLYAKFHASIPKYIVLLLFKIIIWPTAMQCRYSISFKTQVFCEFLWPFYLVWFQSKCLEKCNQLEILVCILSVPFLVCDKKKIHTNLTYIVKMFTYLYVQCTTVAMYSVYYTHRSIYVFVEHMRPGRYVHLYIYTQNTY